MNFNNASNDVRIDSKTPQRKSVEPIDAPKGVDRVAMKSATRAQKRLRQNENTNSGNSMFTK